MTYGINLNEPNPKEPPKAFILPYWYKPFLKSNNLSPIDLLNPKNLTKYLSYTDIADLISAQQLLPAIPTIDIIQLFTKNKEPFPTGQQFLSESSMLTFRERFQDDVHTQSDTSYEVLQLTDEIFLIYLEPSFLDALEYRDKTLQFVSDCLKTYYSYASISKVSCMSIFRYYLDLINPRIPFRSLSVAR